MTYATRKYYSNAFVSFVYNISKVQNRDSTLTFILLSDDKLREVYATT